MFKEEIELKGKCIRCGAPIVYKGIFSGDNQICAECKKKLNVNISNT